MADPKNAWWKPLAEGGIGLGFFVVFQIILSLPLIISEFTGKTHIFGAGAGSQDALTNAAFDNPWIFAFLFASIAVMFPALWLARLILGPKPWGLIHSVAGRLRWGWMFSCGAIGIVIYYLVPLAISLLAHENQNATMWREQASEPLWIFLLLLFLLVPIQCYAEELVFRGYLMQTIGRWLKHPAWAILLPAPLFMLGHDYDLWGQLAVLCLGVTAGFLVWYTGGLEAAIALHVINNLFSMYAGIMGISDPFARGGSTPLAFLTVFSIEVFYALAVVFLARKRKIQRRQDYTAHLPATPAS